LSFVRQEPGVRQERKTTGLPPAKENREAKVIIAGSSDSGRVVRQVIRQVISYPHCGSDHILILSYRHLTK